MPVYAHKVLAFLFVFSVLVVGLNNSGWAQITTLNNWTNVYHGTSSTTQTINYTVPTGSNSNRVLVVAIATSTTAVSARTVTLTYGGQTPTASVGDIAGNNIQHTQIYYFNEAKLDAASNTTLSVAVSSGTTSMTDVFVAVFDGVDQSSPVTNSQTYNSGTSAVNPFQFATALTVNANDQAIEIFSTVRTGSTTARTISSYPTNWTSGAGEQTGSYDPSGTANDQGIRNAVANRSIPISNTTDFSSVNLSGTARASMTAISLKAFALSYCIPTYSTGTGEGDYVGSVQLGDINNTTLGSASPFYTYYSSLSTDLALGTNYTITVGSGTYTSANNISVWIDFDQSGSFDTSEKLGNVVLSGNSTGTINFTVPSGAILGKTRLRVRESWNTSLMDPCTGYNYGETEDYNVKIVTPCTNATLTLTTSNSAQTVCKDASVSSIAYLVGGDATGASASGLPAGVSGSYNSSTHIFTISGIPTVTGTFNFTVTTSGTPLSCLEATAAGTITVNDKPAITAISAPAALCAGSSLNPSVPVVTANGSTVSAQGWQLETGVGTGLFNNLSVPYNVVYADNGKKIRYYATNGCGTTNGNEVAVTVHPLPSATLSGSVVLCESTSTNLTVTLTGTPPWSVTYTYGTNSTTINGINSSPHSISVNPTSSITYSLTAVSDANCTGTTSGSASVIVDNEVLFAQGNDTTICEGGTATLKINLLERAIQLNGTDGRIDIPNSVEINTYPGTSLLQNRTVALWFKANDVTNQQVLFEEGAGVNGFSIFLQGGYINVHAWENNASWGEVRTAVSVGNWYHVAFVFNASSSGYKFEGFLDGVSFGGNSDPNANDGLNAHSGDITIGQSDGIRFPDGSTSSGNYYYGYIDEFKLWNRSLTANELLGERWNVNDGTNSGANLVVYYNFNNDASPTVTDETGGNDGTLFNGVTYEQESPFTPSISWSPGGMNTFTTIVTPIITTVYTYKLTHPFSGCETTGNIEVSVNPLPTAAINAGYSICEEENAVFTITGTSGATVNYNINGGANTPVVLSGGSAVVTVNAVTTNQTLTLVSVSDTNCSKTLSDNSTITVNPLPATGEIIPD